MAPTFLDYIMGGVEISFIVAVDFTASNGDPRNTDSLHYCRPDGACLCAHSLRMVHLTHAVDAWCVAAVIGTCLLYFMEVLLGCMPSFPKPPPASNGDPWPHLPLPSLSPPSPPRLPFPVQVAGSLTPYEEAIYGIGRVIEFYDSDKLFPAFGFGGARQGGPVSHCFNLNDTPNPQCAGVAGINAAYRCEGRYVHA